MLLAVLAGIFFIVSLLAVAVPFKAEKGLVYWAGVLVLLIITANILALASLFDYYKRSFLVILLASGLSILVFFPWHWLQILSVLFVFTATLAGVKSMAKTREERLHFSYYHTVKQGLRYFFVAFVFLASLNVYLNTFEALQEDPERFYQNISHTVVRSMQPVLESNVQSFSPEITLDQFLIREQYFDTKDIRRDEKGDLSARDLTEVREQVLSVFGVEASGDEQLTHVLDRIVLLRVRDIFEPLKDYIPAIYAILLFLSLRFLVPIMVWLSAGLGALLFKLFVRIGFINIVQKQVVVETPQLN